MVIVIHVSCLLTLQLIALCFALILITYSYLFSFSLQTVKPFLIRGPQNQTVVTGSSVIFQCRVGGEPLPDVLWRRTASGGNMPLGELLPCLLGYCSAHIKLNPI